MQQRLPRRNPRRFSRRPTLGAGGRPIGGSSPRQLSQAAMPDGAEAEEGQDGEVLAAPDPMAGEAGMAFFRESLARNARRVVDILKEWHRNGEDGIVLDEMHALAAKLQINVPAEAVQGVFAQWDSTHSGKLELAELERKLKGMGRSVSVSHVPPASI